MTLENVRQAFTPKQIQIGAAFFHDGATQAEIADQFGLSQPAVSQIISTLKRRAAGRNWPTPRRFKVADTKHVGNIDPEFFHSN